MKRLFVVSVSLLCAGAAHASPTPSGSFTVNGASYDITYVTAAFNAIAATLEAQPWWGNSVLATTFAGDVGSALGTPNVYGPGNAAGPDFAYGSAVAVDGEEYVPLYSGANFYDESFSAVVSYAELVPAAAPTAVPEPTSLVLLGGALGALGLIRRRRRE